MRPLRFSIFARRFPIKIFEFSREEVGVVKTYGGSYFLDALMDLSDVFEEGGIDDDTPLKDQVIDGLLDSAKCSPYGDGKIYIAPFDASPMGLVYNKTLFEENGWETPVTWDDFFELGDKAKEKGIALFTYQGIYPGYLESMLWPALASATGIDNMKAIASYTPGSLSSDEALKVFQNMAKIGTDGYLMDGTVALNHTQSQTDMMMNKALFIPNGNWMEGEMADAPRADGFEFGLTCAPVLDDGETRYVMSSVEQFEIPANAKNPELAKEFLRFLYTEDSVKLFAEKANGIYALKKANEMVKGIVTDGVYNMNDIYQEGTFMVFGWDAIQALKNTAKLMAVVPVITIFCSLVLAFVLNQCKLKEMVLYRTIFYFPNIVSLTVVGIIWSFVFHPNVGIINKILGAVGLESLQRSWLGDSKTALWCIAFTLLWQAAGYYMVMHIAAMDGISPEIYESATLDGASAWRKLVSITMPLMKDIIGITFVLALSGTINLSFVLSQVMTGGGPNGASSVLLQYMYTQGFVNGNFGYAMAITVFTLAISVALSMLSRKLTDASEGGQ